MRHELSSRQSFVITAAFPCHLIPQVAIQYAKSNHPLIFKYKTLGPTRGCLITYLSLYPRECEYLYPPLTFLTMESDPYTEDDITYIDVAPQMS